MPSNQHTHYTSVRLAAYDKRIADRAWLELDAGRKELLLPLRTPALVRAAARHVAAMNLSQSKTRDYVAQALAAAGTPKRTRLTSKTLATRVRKAHAGLGTHDVLRKVRELGRELEDSERAGILRELTQLRAALGSLMKAIRGR